MLGNLVFEKVLIAALLYNRRFDFIVDHVVRLSAYYINIIIYFKMGKLNVTILRYLTKEDFRVLIAVSN